MENLQPKLRFPEFREEWEETILSNIAKIQMGQSPDSNSYNNNNLGFGLIQGNADLIDRKVQLRQHTSKPTKLTNINDIIFTVRAPVGYVALCEDIYCIGRGVASITANYSIGFLFQYFIKVEERWNTLAQGSTFTAINSKELNNFKLNIPTLQEQTKIANFLGAVDKQLDILNQKKEKLNTYKKGVMQQLFAQQLRFKDDNGNNYPDWEEKTLGEVGEIVSGLTYSPKDVVDEGLLVLRSSNIQDNKLSFQDNVFVNVKKYNPVEAEDILICVRNGSKNLIGKNALITKNEKGFAFGAFMTIYRSKSNKYIFQWLQHSTYREYVNKNLGATINSINGNDLKKFLIPFPSIEEQTKIANFLSAIDKQIEAVENQITKTETYKKGLLQQMFV
ncbi:type I restriction enzyme, S subunit [Algoriella xinjiangensis]|uniref:Type I restriction enzyme, S subunit n=1 Tax=Algoriella xinjiangensis TaxID=684065 RepID=A0A1I4W913_9FLAO|nr:restriction endonuclease subunit S [Algoriella xinjiangensis]SFN09917.1 type I restriction enzyme, S subunit [Algoriella xinjiangensis]